MSFLKSVASFIWAHILLLVGIHTPIYIAPVAPTSVVQIATTTIVIKPPATTTSKTVATTTKPKTATPKPVAKPTTQIPITITPPEPPPNFKPINAYAREATVNILCTTKGGELSPISGTGVVVKPDGLILTNAHIGQYFLLKDFREKDFLNCVIRTGSPASPVYKAELVYISPTWVAANKDLLKEKNPTGTGENDFAFLRITGMIDGSNLPTTFPYIQMNVRENINVNEPVLLVSYPAGFLGGISILRDLSITSAITNIQDIFTFKDGTVDVVAVGGTVVSQKGSSGGLVVDRNATLVGIITTSTDASSTSQRGLNAITLAYINRDLESELGINLESFVTQDMPEFAKKFQEINAPSLTKIIEDELNKP